MALVKSPLQAFSPAGLVLLESKNLQLDVFSPSKVTVARLPNHFFCHCTKRFSGYGFLSDMQYSSPDRLCTLLRSCWGISGNIIKESKNHLHSNRIQYGVSENSGKFSSRLVRCSSFEVAEKQLPDDGDRGQRTYSGTIVESPECDFSAYKEDPVAFGNSVETATFGLGCFWSPDSLYGAVPGVVRTRVGYSGGSSRNPSYDDIGNHTEVKDDEGVPSFWAGHFYSIISCNNLPMAILAGIPELQNCPQQSFVIFEKHEISCFVLQKTPFACQIQLIDSHSVLTCEHDRHLECVQIEYDPAVVSFGDILKVFWKNHDPTTRGFVSQQYASLILVHTSEQLQLAKADLERLQSLTPKKIRTRIEVAKKFFLAEGYHQKFSLRNHPDLLPMLFPDGIEWRTYIDSPMAARINGLLASANGKVSHDGVTNIFEEFNVPLPAQEYIKEVIVKRKRML